VVGERVVAQVLDWVAITALSVAAAVGLASVGVLGRNGPVLVLLLAGFCYNAGLEAFWGGQTVGKRVLDIRVRSRHGGEASLGQTVLRNVPALVSPGLLLYAVALLSIATDREKRRLFDRLADTVVVRSY